MARARRDARRRRGPRWCPGAMGLEHGDVVGRDRRRHRLLHPPAGARRRPVAAGSTRTTSSPRCSTCCGATPARRGDHQHRHRPRHRDRPQAARGADGLDPPGRRLPRVPAARGRCSQKIREALKPDGRVALVEYRAEGDSAAHIHGAPPDVGRAGPRRVAPRRLRARRAIETLPSQHLFISPIRARRARALPCLSRPAPGCHCFRVAPGPALHVRVPVAFRTGANRFREEVPTRWPRAP